MGPLLTHFATLLILQHILPSSRHVPTTAMADQADHFIPSAHRDWDALEEVSTATQSTANSTAVDGEVDAANYQAGSVSRKMVLIPDLDAEGNPLCLSSPSDTFCESVPDYPRSEIQQDLELTPRELVDSLSPQAMDSPAMTLNGRKAHYPADEDPDEERVCSQFVKIIYPQMAKNEEGYWRYVVNDNDYSQAVQAEVCEKQGKPCLHMDHLPPGSYSLCKQKYSYKRLLALHPTEKRTYSDTFQFPACCVCYVKSPFGSRNSRSVRNSPGRGTTRRSHTVRSVRRPWDGRGRGIS